MTTNIGRFALAAGLAIALIAPTLGTPAQAQAPRDEALEKLLEKLDAPKPNPADEADKPKPKPADDPAKPPGDKPKPAGDPSRPPGEVGSKDRSLDELLEGLGQSTDKPSADEKKPGGGQPDQPPKPGDGKGPGEEGKDDNKNPGGLDEGSKDLDDILDEITGHKPKKKPSDKKPGQGQGGGQGQGEDDEEGAGPLGELVKKMRDVEGRLERPDTGDETRQKQVEIVKNLDTLIEEMKKASSQGQAMKMARGQGKPGGTQPQPGQGNQPGANGQEGVGMSKPTPPRTPPAPVELAKEVWGQLPPQLRDDMANILNESPLPSKADLIRLYYLSLSKRSSAERSQP